SGARLMCHPRPARVPARLHVRFLDDLLHAREGTPRSARERAPRPPTRLDAGHPLYSWRCHRLQDLRRLRVAANPCHIDGSRARDRTSCHASQCMSRKPIAACIAITYEWSEPGESLLRAPGSPVHLILGERTSGVVEALWVLKMIGPGSGTGS